MQPVIIQTPNINIYLKFNCQQEKILPTKNSQLTVWNFDLYMNHITKMFCLDKYTVSLTIPFITLPKSEQHSC